MPKKKTKVREREWTVTIREAAKIANVAPNTIRRCLADGRLIQAHHGRDYNLELRDVIKLRMGGSFRRFGRAKQVAIMLDRAADLRGCEWVNPDAIAWRNELIAEAVKAAGE